MEVFLLSVYRRSLSTRIPATIIIHNKGTSVARNERRTIKIKKTEINEAAFAFVVTLWPSSESFQVFRFSEVDSAIGASVYKTEIRKSRYWYR